jgi:hypothetical protein
METTGKLLDGWQFTQLLMERIPNFQNADRYSARYFFQEVKICQISTSYRFAGLFIEFFLQKDRMGRDGERSYRESILP